MLQLRPAQERGRADFGWLKSRHTFSFGNYYDPAHMGFRALRVINDDRVAPGGGFPAHPHRDMEILSYVVEGGLAHEDSTGGGSVIRPGELQRMSAGRGIVHSEFNASDTEAVRFLQIWIIPSERGLAPGYEQRGFPVEERSGRPRLLASPDGRDGSLTVHQDVAVYGALLANGDEVRHALAPGRHAWVQVVKGAVTLNGRPLVEGDGAALSGEPEIVLRADDTAELLFFDLA